MIKYQQLWKAYEDNNNILRNLEDEVRNIAIVIKNRMGELLGLQKSNGILFFQDIDDTVVHRIHPHTAIKLQSDRLWHFKIGVVLAPNPGISVDEEDFRKKIFIVHFKLRKENGYFIEIENTKCSGVFEKNDINSLDTILIELFDGIIEWLSNRTNRFLEGKVEDFKTKKIGFMDEE
jgi:hypothetical protein